METSSTDLQRIGAVVPAHNAGATLGPCLDALLAAGLTPNSICVVDDGSTDTTQTVAKARGVHLRVQNNRGAAAARNVGARALDTDILLFVDADVTVADDALPRLATRFQDPDTMAVFGAYDAVPPHGAPISRLRNLYHHHTHLTHAGPVASFWTGIGAVRKHVFQELEGFNPNQDMLEDIEFGLRLHGRGYRTLLDPKIQGSHWKIWTLAKMMRTDIWDRAVPWTKLLETPLGRAAPRSLNVSTSGKASVLGVASMLVSIPLALFSGGAGLGLGLAGAFTVGYANRGFLAYVQKREGAAQVPAAFVMLVLHFFCAGLGFALVKARLA